MHVMRAVSSKPELPSVECVFPSVLLYVPRDFVKRFTGQALSRRALVVFNRGGKNGAVGFEYAESPAASWDGGRSAGRNGPRARRSPYPRRSPERVPGAMMISAPRLVGSAITGASASADGSF
jgi:hypothetical protein